MTRIKKIFLWLITVGLTGCEPGLSGDLKVFNDTNQMLTIKFTPSKMSDTILTAIQPNSNEIIKVLGGIGSNNTLNCCPCELNSIEIRSPQGKIKKDPGISDNWIIPNKKKLKKFGGQDVKCEFHVENSDL